jgi:hypothetical protein
MGRCAVQGVTFELSVQGAVLASGKPIVVHMSEALARHHIPEARPSVPKGVRSYLRLQAVLCCTSQAANDSLSGRVEPLKAQIICQDHERPLSESGSGTFRGSPSAGGVPVSLRCPSLRSVVHCWVRGLSGEIRRKCLKDQFDHRVEGDCSRIDGHVVQGAVPRIGVI